MKFLDQLGRRLLLIVCWNAGCQQTGPKSEAPSPSLEVASAEQQPTSEKAPPVSAGTTSLLSEARNLRRGLTRLLQPLPKSARFLSLTVLHRQVILQVQNPDNLAKVLEYRLRDGALTRPVTVTLMGPGKLQDNLFPRQSADPRAAPRLLREFKQKYAGSDYSLVRLTMRRNLPRSRDILFRLFFRGPDGDLMVTGDKHGRLLEEPRKPEPDELR